MAEVILLGVPEFDRALERMVARVTEETPALTEEAGRGLQQQAQANARVLTGALRESIEVQGPSLDGGAWSVRVGSALIYSRRIEEGFHGTDSLGRTYNQQGSPYIRPALRRASQAFAGLSESRWARAIGVL